MKCLTVVILICLWALPNIQAQDGLELPKKMYKTWIIPVQREPVRKGLLFGVQDSSVIISNSLRQEDYLRGHYSLAEMGYENINMVKVRKSGKLEKGIIIGGIAGFATGLAFGLYYYSTTSRSDIFGDSFNVLGTALIIIGGTGAGVGIGFASTGFKINIPIHGSREAFDKQKDRLNKYSYQEIAGNRVPKPRMFEKSQEKVTDIDKNSYETVIAGGRIWMADNLKVTHFSNGDPIPELKSGIEWSEDTSGAFCNPMNNPANVTGYGRLYNRFAVNDTRNICPAGWHVPTFAEWKVLIDTLGGAENAGSVMNDTRISQWSKVNRGNAPYSAFADLAGSRDRNGAYSPPGTSERLWWTKGDDQEIIIGLLLENKRNDVRFVSRDAGENSGMSVRCIKD